MSVCFGFVEAELSSTDNHLNLVLYPLGNKAVQRESPRNSVHDGQHVGAKVLLQRGGLIEVVQHNLRYGVALENNNQTLTGAPRRFVANIGYSGELAILHQLGNLDC